MQNHQMLPHGRMKQILCISEIYDRSPARRQIIIKTHVKLSRYPGNIFDLLFMVCLAAGKKLAKTFLLYLHVFYGIGVFRGILSKFRRCLSIKIFKHLIKIRR